jgi:hypothetical protein
VSDTPSKAAADVLEQEPESVDVVETDAQEPAESETVESEPAESESLDSPPAGSKRRLAEKSWWLPWLLGAAALVVAVLMFTGAFEPGEPKPEDKIRDRQSILPISTHSVVYEVTGTGKAPEIRYVVDGSATTDKVENVDLPWRKEVQMTVGPGVGIAQLLAANGDAPSITCSVTVDGQVVNQGVAQSAYSSVACSAVVRPLAEAPK